MAFEDLLAEIKEETDRTNLAEMAKRFPSLRSYVELGQRAEKVAPNMKALGYKEDEFEGATVELEKWRDLRKKNYDEERKLWRGLQTEEQVRADQLVAEATARIAELEAERGNEMTHEEIKTLAAQVAEEVLKGKGFLNSAELDKAIAEKISPEIRERVGQLEAGFVDVYAKLTPKVTAHEREFGKPIEFRKLMDHMREHTKKTGQMLDPDEAYAQVYGSEIQAKAEERRQAEIKSARDEGVAEGRRMASQSSGGKGIPIDGGGGPMMSPAIRKTMEQRRAATEASAKAGQGTVLGKGLLAAQQAQELRDRDLAAG